eukprot:g9062.t1
MEELDIQTFAKDSPLLAVHLQNWHEQKDALQDAETWFEGQHKTALFSFGGSKSSGSSSAASGGAAGGDLSSSRPASASRFLRAIVPRMGSGSNLGGRSKAKTSGGGNEKILGGIKLASWATRQLPTGMSVGAANKRKNDCTVDDIGTVGSAYRKRTGIVDMVAKDFDEDDEDETPSDSDEDLHPQGAPARGKGSTRTGGSPTVIQVAEKLAACAIGSNINSSTSYSSNATITKRKPKSSTIPRYSSKTKPERRTSIRASGSRPPAFEIPQPQLPQPGLGGAAPPASVRPPTSPPKIDVRKMQAQLNALASPSPDDDGFDLQNHVEAVRRASAGEEVARMHLLDCEADAGAVGVDETIPQLWSTTSVEGGGSRSSEEQDATECLDHLDVEDLNNDKGFTVNMKKKLRTRNTSVKAGGGATSASSANSATGCGGGGIKTRNGLKPPLRIDTTATLTSLWRLQKEKPRLRLGNYLLLNVHRCYLDDPTLQSLSLSQLSLPHATEKRVFPKLLAALKWNTSLENLDLHEASLEKVPGILTDLADVLRCNKTLKYLDLSGNGFTAEHWFFGAGKAPAGAGVSRRTGRTSEREHITIVGSVGEDFAKSVGRNQGLEVLNLYGSTPEDAVEREEIEMKDGGAAWGARPRASEHDHAQNNKLAQLWQHCLARSIGEGNTVLLKLDIVLSSVKTKESLDAALTRNQRVRALRDGYLQNWNDAV